MSVVSRYATCTRLFDYPIVGIYNNIMPNQGKTKPSRPAGPKKPAQKERTKRAKSQAGVAARPARSAVAAPDYDLLLSLLGYALRRTQLAVFQHFARSMAQAAGEARGEAKGDGRVSPGEFGVLVLVEANPGINQTSLANAVGADRSTMVPIIDRMERRGLLERQAVPGDRRAHALRLAKSAKERMRRFRATVIEHEKRIAADLSAAERQVLLDLLRKLRQSSEAASDTAGEAAGGTT
jgi:DNA-binding MarR family transcriptional regulator